MPSTYPNQSQTMHAIQKKAFGGRAIGFNSEKGDGVPSHASKLGSLYWDYTNSDAYICTVAAGTWVKINA